MSMGFVFGARCAEREASWLLLAARWWLLLTVYKPKLYNSLYSQRLGHFFCEMGELVPSLLKPGLLAVKNHA